jgi:hypothetical protein
MKVDNNKKQKKKYIMFLIKKKVSKMHEWKKKDLGMTFFFSDQLGKEQKNESLFFHLNFSLPCRKSS